jgi:hypothetical protein
MPAMPPEQLLARSEADALDIVLGQEGAHGLGSAGAAQDEVVRRIVALLERAVHQVVERGVEHAALHRRPDRLVEHGHVGVGHRNRRLQVDHPAIDLLERGKRHPELADALLREIRGAVIMAGPAGLDVLDGNADIAVEGAADRLDARVERGLRGELRRRRGTNRFGQHGANLAADVGAELRRLGGGAARAGSGACDAVPVGLRETAAAMKPRDKATRRPGRRADPLNLRMITAP